ncbi:hypothetical protein CDAR_607791 [Caerostris darwini]|uniref:Uncharacterized protein n=1 Tax=Caerostris darwini TaxID=1538125 RepID=A0AAV4ULB0_9ARAC|nr:hypothetical protein CDAR_607791 [Caerostris darwini]
MRGALTSAAKNSAIGGTQHKRAENRSAMNPNCPKEDRVQQMVVFLDKKREDGFLDKMKRKLCVQQRTHLSHLFDTYEKNDVEAVVG